MEIHEFLLRAHLVGRANPDFAVQLLTLIADGARLCDDTILRAAGPRAIKRIREELQTEAFATWLARSARLTFVCYTDDAYPQRLRETAQPPLVLFYQGDLMCLTQRSLAVIGARRAGRYSLESLRQLLPDIPANVAIVSGLAYGADGFAHQVGLETGHRPIGVIGTAINRAYPRENAALQAQVAERGLLISEYAPGMPTLPVNFVARNRIIAGLAHGLLVTEAAHKSGSLITANMALDAGRTVFALPNLMNAPLGVGTNELIQQGAILVSKAPDILAELNYFD